ncbi:MAG: DUF3500 domain-containing protein [bacterium]
MLAPTPLKTTWRMPLSFGLLALSGLLVGGVFWLSAWAETSGGRMASSAERLVASIDDAQKAKINFPFDTPERLNWHFIPRERKGLSIKEMTPAQRSLAFGLVSSGVGSSGFQKVTTIMSLEQILRDLEQGKGPVRDPELYFVSIFGTPAATGKWGWRFEGHHLSMNVTVEDGKILSATPVFFGSNPGEVKTGPRKGLRTLGDIEDAALRVVQALNPDQAKKAIVAEKAPSDIRGANTPQAPTDAPVGLAFGDMNGDQQKMMQKLVESFAGEMPIEVSKAWMDEIIAAGPEKVHFAWQGPADLASPHGFRVQGPTFIIEFNNTQNNANHIHAGWRSMLGDFGIPAAK